MGDFDALVELARESGSDGFTALNLVTEVQNPDAHAHLRGAGRDS